MDEALKQHERAVELFYVYKGILTPSMQEVYSDYYCYDLSLSEISDNRHISRSAVSDSLKKSLQKMEKIEKSVGYLEKKKHLNELVKDIEKADEDKKNRAIEALGEYVKNGL
ncbi:MAG: transcriptional regulator [Bacilli bacterium]|jgi:predicted DNA-binding protein YlxM (UPF0122 family)|nr:transcriptional regulator [Bacilli bacterium]MCH4228349.1 transcriptional regulator [Bacilli bacterium]MCH4277649.1 transcriptional regulator [Bacilli bacterium]